MKPKEDHPFGLWSNLRHGKEVGGFTWSEIADQMSFYVAGVGRKRLTRALERIVIDRQLTSRYVSALARAWRIPDVVLLHGHFVTCATPEALKEQTGFDADGIVARWHQNREHAARSIDMHAAVVQWFEAMDKDASVFKFLEEPKEPDPEDKEAG